MTQNYILSQTENRKLQNTINNFNDKLNDETKKIIDECNKKLISEKSNIENTLKIKYEKELKEQKDIVNIKNKKISELEQQNEQMNDTIQEFQCKINEQNEKNKGKIVLDKNEYDKMQNTIKEHLKTIENKNKEINKLNDDLKMKGNNNNPNSKVDSLEKNLKSSKEYSAKLKKYSDDLAKKYNEFIKKYNDLVKKFNSNKAELDLLKKKNDDSIKQEVDKYNKLKIDYDKLVKEGNGKNVSNNTTTSKELADVKNENVKVKKELTDVKNENTKIKKELTDVKNENVKVKKELTDVKNENEKVKKELTDVKNENEKVKKELTDKNKTIEEIELSNIQVIPQDEKITYNDNSILIKIIEENKIEILRLKKSIDEKDTVICELKGIIKEISKPIIFQSQQPEYSPTSDENSLPSNIITDTLLTPTSTKDVSPIKKSSKHTSYYTYNTLSKRYTSISNNDTSYISPNSKNKIKSLRQELDRSYEKLYKSPLRRTPRYSM